MALSDESSEIEEINLDNSHLSTRCINRHCKHGDDLIKALDFVCNYYHVRYKPNKEVCSNCFRKCVNHFYNLGAKMDRGECILQAEFPSYDSYVVIESSSSEDEGEDKTEKHLRVPKEIRKLVPTDPDILALADLGFKYWLEIKKEKIDEQIELCKNENKKMLQECTAGADWIDAQADDLEKEMKELKDSVYEPYEPILVVEEIVDLDELSNNNERECVEQNCNSNINQNEENTETEEQMDRDITVNSIMVCDIPDDLENTETEEQMDRDIITVNSIMVCDIPDDLPNEGPLEYPTLQIGQQMFGKKFTLLDPWYKCKIQAIINEDYLRMRFSSDEKALTTKELAYFDPSPVRFSIGSRVLAKLSKIDNQLLSNYYAGVIAEPPKLLNKFRYN